MNAPQGSSDVGVATPGASKRRQRAAFAQRLLSKAPDSAALLDWDSLDHAPAWLGLPETELTTFQCQVGAVLHAPALRLWIDGPRLGSARLVLGDAFLQALLAQPDSAAIPIDLVGCPRIDSPSLVGALLKAAGASVLLASMPHGSVRRVAGAALAPTNASPIAQALAQSLVSQAQALASKVAISTPSATTVESAA